MADDLNGSDDMANKSESDLRTLIDEKNKYLTIFNSLQSPVAVLDREGRIDTVNPAWSALFGMVAEPAIDPDQAEPDHDPAACLAPVITQFITGGMTETTVERSVDTVVGTRHLVIRIRRREDDHARFTGCVVMLEDVTSEKQAAAAACDSERLQGALALAGAVCHDLNQPLMAISGYAELLLMNCAQDAPHFSKLKKLAAQVERVGDITRKLMHVTRYETKAYMDRQIIDIEKASETA